MDIVILLRVLARKKWYLILIPIVAVVATYFFTSGMKPVYMSTAKLATGFTTNDQIQIDEERFNLRDADVKFNNLIQTMTSESVLALLSYRLMLNDLESASPFNPIPADAEVRLSAPEKKKAIEVLRQRYDSIELLSSFDRFEAKLLELLAQQNYAGWQLKEQAGVKHVKGTDFITIQYSSTNPLLSAFVVNTLGEEYIRYDNSLRSTRSGQSVTFFESLAKEKKKIFDEKTTMLNEFKISNNVMGETESSSKVAQIAEYELRREQALSDIQRIRLSLASVRRKIDATENGTSTAAGEDQASIQTNIVRIREKITQLTDEYNRTRSEDLNSAIKELRYQLKVEENRLQNTGTVAPSTIYQELLSQREQYELELQIANANLGSIESMIGALRGRVSGVATKEATISALQSEVDKAKEEYISALDRFNTERSKSMVANSSVRIVVKGQPNGHAEFSQRYLLIGLSGVASFILCAFVIIFMEYVDVRIKNPVQFRKMVKVPLAGSVNMIDTKNLNLAELFAGTIKNQEMEVFKHFLRKLRFEVEASKAKVLLVTSTKPGEGKTFIILCVAYLLSLLQKKVLIIDTNFKNNSLTQILLRKNQNVRKLEQGIFIRGQIGAGTPHEMSEDDFTSTIISPTGHKGISIIGNNGGNESPSEIFAGRDFGEMIRKLGENFDYIIMEGASLNNYSDTKELIDFADKVLAVFSAESVLKQLDRESIDYLKHLNGKFMGAVLNKISTKELAI